MGSQRIIATSKGNNNQHYTNYFSRKEKMSDILSDASAYLDIQVEFFVEQLHYTL